MYNNGDRRWLVIPLGVVINHACAVPSQSIDDASAKTNSVKICEVDNKCALEGKLISKGTPQARLFEIDSSQGRYCIVVNKVDEQELVAWRGGTIRLVGILKRHNESPDCAYLDYGDTRIPCGYCGGEIFVAAKIGN